MELKNRCSEVLELVGLFLLKREGFSWLLYFALLIKTGLKKEGQIQNISLLTSHLELTCSSCIADCIRRRFLITQFLAIKLWARIPLQIEDSPLVIFIYLYVNFQKCVSLAF